MITEDNVTEIYCISDDVDDRKPLEYKAFIELYIG